MPKTETKLAIVFSVGDLRNLLQPFTDDCPIGVVYDGPDAYITSGVKVMYVMTNGEACIELHPE